MLEAIAELLPTADLITNVRKSGVAFGHLAPLLHKETFISRLPFAEAAYRAYMPLMPLALEHFDMSQYDLVISSEAGPAKWIIPRPDARHICYCHSPIRYIWDQRSVYFARYPAPMRLGAEMIAGSMRKSDALSSLRVDTFVANSSFVAQRIWKYYRRDAIVIHPPISVDEYNVCESEDYYLVAGEYRAYKRFDLAVRACTNLGKRLIVVGEGTDSSALKKLAGSTVTFRGRASKAEFRNLLSRCKALLFPGVEDFGIIPVEAMASGSPVIAQGRGGALDTVKSGVSGFLYEGETEEALATAILEFEASDGQFTARQIADYSRRFDRSIFLRNFSDILNA